MLAHEASHHALKGPAWVSSCGSSLSVVALCPELALLLMHTAKGFILPVSASGVLLQTAQAFSLACIAEAQALTVLRAVQKGNAPSLVASLATDASAAFKSAAGTAGGVVISAKAESKFLLFADYQAKAMEALSQAFAGDFLQRQFSSYHSM